MNKKKFSNNQENHIAKVLGGKKVANSGATPFNKGDVITDLFVIECKTKTKESKSMNIQKDWIDTIKTESFAMGRAFSAVAFNFGGLHNNENYYIIDEELFKMLHQMLEDKYK